MNSLSQSKVALKRCHFSATVGTKRSMARNRMPVYLPAEMAADLQRCANLSHLSCNATILTALRHFFRRMRQDHPEAFPAPPEFSTQERLILEAIDAACWTLDDITRHTGYQDAPARRLLRGLVERGVLEIRRTSKTETARGKTPVIYVRTATPAGSRFDARPSARAAGIED